MSDESAAFHGLATNRALPIEERFGCALQALELYEAEVDAMRPVVEAARAALKNAVVRVITIQGQVAEAVSGSARTEHTTRAYAGLTKLADNQRGAGADRPGRDRELRAAVDALDGAS